ncbi:hypothetical protein HELRODRAFT_178480 [Helobdella robusta]|uniref:Uncharacterized protein n=1 Tax=Helobdella robusta TaxID=6412 RepID=T1FD86_HELRO|nr:hypothetical protein HELRODRAFT_178480 [Helobdella robusta]ESN97036.1 hypothetical protein HELRODRAFT_178480 [Helobdella robusta]
MALRRFLEEAKVLHFDADLKNLKKIPASNGSDDDDEANHPATKVNFANLDENNDSVYGYNDDEGDEYGEDDGRFDEKNISAYVLETKKRIVKKKIMMRMDEDEDGGDDDNDDDNDNDGKDDDVIKKKMTVEMKKMMKMTKMKRKMMVKMMLMITTLNVHMK